MTEGIAMEPGVAVVVTSAALRDINGVPRIDDKNYMKPGEAARRDDQRGRPEGVRLVPGEVRERDDLAGRMQPLGF